MPEARRGSAHLEAEMHEQEMAIAKALVPVAWADGTFSNHEKETLEGLLSAFDATPDEKAHILGYAAEKRTLADIDLQELGTQDRRVLLQYAVLLTYASGAQSQEDAKFLEQLATYLKIPAEESKAVMAAAAERAKKLMGHL
jgi:tellurite resistance protein